MESLTREFKNYIKDNRVIFIPIVVFTFLMYGCRIFDKIAALDTEVVLEKSANYKEWLTMGRQGLYALKYMFRLANFEPYYSGVTAIVATLIVVLAWTFLFYYIWSDCDKIPLLCFACVLLSNPVWSEQFYFKSQITEILIGISIVGISVLLSWKQIEKSNWMLLCFNTVLMAFSFSVYQAMVPLYITGVATTYTLFVLKNSTKTEWKQKEYLMVGVKHILYFVLGFVFNTIITKLFFTGRTYLNDEMVGWGKFPVRICVSYIIQYVKKVLLGQEIYYTYIFSLSIILVVICLVILFAQHIKSGKIFLCLGLLMTWASVFFLSIILGKTPLVRSQFSLPVVVAFDFLFVLLVLKKYCNKKILYNCSVLIVVFALLVQGGSLLRLFYTDSVRDKEDTMLAYEINGKIDSLLGDNRRAKVVFIGNYYDKLNSACVRGEMIGTASMFGFCAENEPINYSSTLRSIFYMHSLGIDYLLPTVEDVEFARTQALDMPCWPNEGSVKCIQGMFIVKLSNHFDPYSIMKGGCEPITISEEQTPMEYKAHIDSVKTDSKNEGVKIAGWGYLKYMDNTASNKVIIKSRKTDKYYEIPTICYERSDLNKDAIDYSKGGFIAKVDKSKLDLENDKYEVYILNTQDGIYHLHKTKTVLSKKNIK